MRPGAICENLQMKLKINGGRTAMRPYNFDKCGHFMSSLQLIGFSLSNSHFMSKAIHYFTYSY
jgi:hypothetical protein